MQKSELKRKKYFLDNYGTYRSAEHFNRLEVLEILFKIFKNFGYEGLDLNEETDVATAIKRLPGGKSDADFDIIEELDEVFDFDEKYEQIKTFGELADLVIKLAKDKKP
jgi:hypothetical protein